MLCLHWCTGNNAFHQGGKIAIFSQNKQRTTFNTQSEPRENVTFLCVGSIPVRNSGFPKRSSCAGSRPDVCVFLYGATKTARSFWTNHRRPGAGRAWTVVDMEKWTIYHAYSSFISQRGKLWLHADLIGKCLAVVWNGKSPVGRRRAWFATR